MSTFSNDESWNISEGDDDCWGSGSSTSITALEQQVNLLVEQVTALVNTTNNIGSNLANHINDNVVQPGEDVHRVNEKYNGIFAQLQLLQQGISALEHSKQNNMSAVSISPSYGEGYYCTPETIAAVVADLNNRINNKQDELIEDSTPTLGHGAGYYVTSAGIKAALDSIEAELLAEAYKHVQAVWKVPADPYYHMTILYLGETSSNFVRGNTYYWSGRWFNASQIQYTKVTIPAGKYVKVNNWEVGSGGGSVWTSTREGAFQCLNSDGEIILYTTLGSPFSSYPNVVYNLSSNIKVGYVPDYGAMGQLLRSTVIANTGYVAATIKVPNYSLGIKEGTFDINNQVTIIGETPPKSITNNKYVLKTTVTTSQSESEPNYISYSWVVDSSTAAIDAVKKTSPIGLIASWWVDANNNIPEGWFPCNGAAVASLSELTATEKQRLSTAISSSTLPIADNMIILGYYPFAREE